MQSKAYSLLIIGMMLLMVIIPASAYDYQGVPRPGENNFANDTDLIDNLGDLSGIFESSEFENLISLFLYFILQLFGLSTY